MILNRETLKDSFEGLVGLYQTENPQYPLLVDSLLGSSSNRFVQDVKPNLLTIENIDQSSKNFERFNYSAYSTTTRDNGGYTIGSKVSFSGNNWEYISSTASSSTTPDPATSEPNVWRQINELSDYLIRTYRQAVDEVMDGWINAKKVRQNTKSIAENILLYNGLANRDDIIPNQDRFVGLRLRFFDNRSIATIINRISTQFTVAVSNLPIYLFHSSQLNAIATFNISSPAISSQWTVWPEASRILRYLDYNLFVGGEYYIGYRQSELEAQGSQAIRKEIVWRQAPIHDRFNARLVVQWYQQYSKFVDITGFEIPENEMPGTANFNPEEVPYTLGTNYGLNLNLSIKCDITDFLIQEKDLFGEALQLTWAYKLLQGIASSTRQGNQITNQIRDEARTELFSRNERFGTVADKMERAFKSIEFDFSALREECLPCDYEGDELIVGTFSLR